MCVSVYHVVLYMCVVITHVRANGDFLFDQEFSFNPANFYIKNANLNYVDVGCGSYNQECSCVTPGEGIMHMHGKGSDGSMTGLDFGCSFAVYEPTQNQQLCQCARYVNIPYIGNNNDRFDCPCLKIMEYKPLDESGHVINIENELRLTPYPKKILYCEKADMGHIPLDTLNCFDPDKTLKNNNFKNATKGKCPDGYPLEHDGKCYGKCAENQVSYKSVCVLLSDMSLRKTAKNACNVLTYQFDEKTDGSCNNDCDCQGVRICRSNKCS